MTGHLEARRMLSLDLDGELADDDAQILRDHLDACDECARHAQRLRSVRTLLRAEHERASDVWAGVLNGLASTGSTDRDVETRGGDDTTLAPEIDAASPGQVATAGVDLRAGNQPSPDRATHGATVARRASASSRWLPAAACLLVGLLIGSALVGGWQGRPPLAAAQVPERIASAQFGVESLSAGIEITERGWHRQVPTRTFSGTLDYEAPESLALHYDDTSTYPSDAWTPNVVDLVLHDRQWWARGLRDCSGLAQPGCTAPTPRLEVVEAIEPFDDGVPVPLDLVVPVRSFLRSGEPTALGVATIDGREGVGVEVTAGQVAPLLDGLRPAGNLRQFFPADVVALWLDAESWTPLRIEVRAADEPDRRTWAANRGYADRPGDEILTVVLSGLRINEGIDRTRLRAAPAGGAQRDAGFAVRRAAPGSPVDEMTWPRVDPASLPDGLEPAVAGIVGAGTANAAAVQTWAGGRGWVKVTTTRTWTGHRLFGDLGSPVRRLDLPGGAVRYASLDGTRVAVHGDGIDVVVTGSIDQTALLAVADGVGIAGRAVPESWPEAATETIEFADDLLPGLLVPPPTPGFEEPAVRADGNVITQAYAGAGGRGFVVVEAPGVRLSPPLDMDTAGVVVRGIDGRYSASRGELEWVESDRVHRLSSSSLSRAELLALASSLAPA